MTAEGATGDTVRAKDAVGPARPTVSAPGEVDAASWEQTDAAVAMTAAHTRGSAFIGIATLIGDRAWPRQDKASGAPCRRGCLVVRSAFLRGSCWSGLKGGSVMCVS